MNLIQRIKAPTPTVYKNWGKVMKNISISLGAGIAAAAALSLPTIIITVTGIIVFLTSSISTYCYAQVETNNGGNENA